eukprot:2447558-Rhodomonas_salina.1
MVMRGVGAGSRQSKLFYMEQRRLAKLNAAFTGQVQPAYSSLSPPKSNPSPLKSNPSPLK